MRRGNHGVPPSLGVRVVGRRAFLGHLTISYAVLVSTLDCADKAEMAVCVHS